MPATPPAAPDEDCRPDATLGALVASMRALNRRAIAEAVTLLEAERPQAAALLRALGPYTGHALVAGFTGPPGAGKSTLVNAVIGILRRQNKRVAVIAVDPSSPVSGGAILGDRVRMTTALDDDGVFVRSLASRGYLGGLSPASVRIIDALDGAGFDVILLETVGTGQSEVDIAQVADVKIVVTAPGLGDDIQAMKAGLIEIADILVVNKADRPGADETAAHLAGARSLRASGAAVPVLKTASVAGTGVEELVDAITKIWLSRLTESGLIRRRKRARYLIARASADRAARALGEAGDARLDDLADRILTGELSPDAAAVALFKG